MGACLTTRLGPSKRARAYEALLARARVTQFAGNVMQSSPLVESGSGAAVLPRPSFLSVAHASKHAGSSLAASLSVRQRGNITIPSLVDREFFSPTRWRGQNAHCVFVDGYKSNLPSGGALPMYHCGIRSVVGPLEGIITILADFAFLLSLRVLNKSHIPRQSFPCVSTVSIWSFFLSLSLDLPRQTHFLRGGRHYLP